MRSKEGTNRSFGKILLISAILTFSGCATKMTIQHECVGSLVQINNNFADDGTTPFDHWSGVLIQLGQYENVPTGFEKIVLKKNGNEVATLDSGTFKWLNIVAERTSSDNSTPLNPPMLSSHLKFLYPEPGTATKICGAVDSCADQDCLCPTPPCDSSNLEKINGECIRQRLLHPDLGPSPGASNVAVITFWQGDGGYSIETTPKGDAHFESTLIFNDKVKIQVDWDVKTYGFGEVDHIEIVEKDPDVHHGSHDGPPLPYP